MPIQPGSRISPAVARTTETTRSPGCPQPRSYPPRDEYKILRRAIDGAQGEAYPSPPFRRIGGGCPMRLPWVAVVLAPLVAGCATARVLERPVAHALLTVVSAETGLPVPGAVVTSGGRALRTNGRGEVVVAGAGPVDVH